MKHARYSLGFMSYCSHDPAAALIRYSADGQTDFIHFEEGMLSRRKKSYHFPLRAIKQALDYYGICIQEVDVVTVDYMDQKQYSDTAKYYRKLVGDYIRRQLKIRPDQLNFAASHHAAHACSAFYSSGFEEAAILAIDGLGSEQQTHSVYVGRHGEEIKNVFSQTVPGIGELYTLVTTALGFEAGEEGKTMGLAPYGSDLKFDAEPDFTGRYQGMLTDFSRIVRRSPSAKLKLELDQELLQQDLYTGYPARVAFLLQKELENSLLHLVSAIKEQTGVKRLCIAGGVGLNCVANEIIAKSGLFEEVYVHSDSGDAGLPHGLAMMGLLKQLPKEEGIRALEQMKYPIFAPETETTRDVASYRKILKDHDISLAQLDYTKVADSLCDKRVVCLFTAGWEYGPRALGHRSFLADPRSMEMKDVMNLKIKHREAYRPFAPIVIADHFDEYFVSNHKNHDRMLYAVGVTERAEKLIPAVVHFDKTARAQTINDPAEPAYKILEAFAAKTGVPVLINTSFNDNDEPIVMSPLDALKCFLNTDADLLIVEDMMLDRIDIDLETMSKLRVALDDELTTGQMASYRSAIYELLNEPEVGLREFLAKRLLSSLYHRNCAAYERLVSEMIGLTQRGERTSVILDDHHHNILKSIAQEYKLPIFNGDLNLILVSDDASALPRVGRYDFVLAYNLCSVIRQEEQITGSQLDVECFYVSGETIIDLGCDNDVEASAEFKALLNTYEVDVSKEIDSLFSVDVKSTFEQMFL